MNSIKKYIKYFLIIYCLFFIFDGINYDNKYLNRSNFDFDFKNLNSKYTKKPHQFSKNLYNKIMYKYFWVVEKPRNNIGKKITIYPKKHSFTESIRKNALSENKTYSEWSRSHGNNYANRFSNLEQVNKENVKNLDVAWIYKSNDGQSGIQANAIVNKGLIYFPTPGAKIVCLNAATGKLVWQYQGTTPNIAKRGLTITTISGKDYIYFTDTNKLVSLNASTGKLNKNFGVNGIIKIKRSVVPPVIIDSYLVVATWYPSVEVFDLETGKILWKYHLREKNSNYGGGNPWGGISADTERGIVYLTTGNPDNYFIGVKRPGKNLYANSVIAIDIKNKKELWKFQETRHDLWNLDMPAAPILTTIKHESKKIDVVIAVTKLGNTIILDRMNGNMINEYQMINVKRSLVKGERSSLKQPYFIKPKPFSENQFKASHIFSFNKNEQKELKESLKNYDFGFYLPSQIGRKILRYNFSGGAEWTGGSIDSENGILYVTANNVLFETEILKKESFFSLKYLNKFKRFQTKEKYPANKPPWGTLTAIDLNTSELIWQVPLGDYQELLDKGFPITGTENFGGATATSGGLVFVSGTLDKKIRAFNKDNGEELWSYIMPNIGSAPPTIYSINKEQYIFLPASGGNSLQTGYPHLVKNSDHFLAFKLKK